MQQLVERGGVDAPDRFGLGDQALGFKLDGDLERRRCRALAGTGLQHVELAALYREFDVLHVAVVLFQALAHLVQLGEDLGHDLFHGRQAVALRFLALDGQVLRRADAGDHVLALCVHQVFAVKGVLAGRGVAGEGDPGGAVLAHVAKDHGLQGDRRAPTGGNVVEPAVGDRALVHPGTEDRADGRPGLVLGSLGEGLAGFRLHQALIGRDHFHPVLGRELGVEADAQVFFLVLQDLFEVVVVHAQHHVAEHLDEAAVAVVGKAPVAAVAGQALHGFVVEAEIQDRVHHAGHRGPCPGAHGNQQGVLGIAEGGTDDGLNPGKGFLHLNFEFFRVASIVVVKMAADFGGDGKAGWHRQAQRRHLGEVGPLAAQKVFHFGIAVGLAAAKGIDPTGHGAHLLLLPILVIAAISFDSLYRIH